MEDLIRRNEAIEKLCKRCQISNDGMCIEGDCIDLKLIRKVPSVDAIPVEFIQKTISEAQAADWWDCAYHLDFLITHWRAEGEVERKEE